MLQEGLFDSERLEAFLNASDWFYEKDGKKGRHQRLDLKRMVENIVISSEKALSLDLKTDSGKTIRPGDVMRSIFNLDVGCIQTARITKLGAQVS